MRHLKKIFGFGTLAVLIACSQRGFQKDPNVDQCQNFDQACNTINGIDYFDYNVSSNGGLVDIIFIDDNSGSMSPEQSNLSNRFNTFLSGLDSRFIDYRIGIITTDVSSNVTSSTSDNSSSSSLYNPPRAINGNGAFQNGNLINFSNGRNLLMSTDSDREALFKQSISRPETKQCENFLRQYPSSPPPVASLIANCPSGDERGIFAANLFVDNHRDTLRTKANLAFVVISDEDERSGLYRTDSGYEFELNDKAETLKTKLSSLLPSKNVSFHSIIVKPGDTTCEAMQNRQMGPASLNPTFGVTYNQIRGTQGYEYAKATQLIGGVLGSVCDSDYSQQLANISASIAELTSSIKLACSTASDLKVSLNGQPVSNYNFDKGALNLGTPIPVGAQLNLKYSCKSL